MKKFEERIMIAAFIVFVISLCVFITEPDFVYGEPRIDNQGTTNMCVAYAVCNGIEEQMKHDGLEVPENGFSKQWLWDKCLDVETGETGLTYKTALNVAMNYGLCPAYEYCTDSAITDKAAEKYKIATYSAIGLRSIEETILDGEIVLVMTTLDRENWKDGILTSNEESVTEYHATYLYDLDYINTIADQRKYFIGVNSWGDQWGFNGKYYMRNIFSGLMEAYTVKF